jgi:hypothetical protein
MEIRYEQQKTSNDLAEQGISNELVKLVRKLRWIGLKGEAERVEYVLTLRGMAAETDSVVAGPRETD